VEEHLASCADCRASLADNVWVRSRITSLQGTPVEADIAEATMYRIRNKATTRWPARRLLRPALVVAAVVIAVLVPLIMQLSGTGPTGGIAGAYSAFAGLQSYRMTGSTITETDGVPAEVSFDWAFVASDRYQGRMTGGDGLREFIIVGE